MKHAFSLIELLIVVLIVGVIYTLSISNFENIKEGKVTRTLSNLKPYLHELKKTKKAEIICLDECESCQIYVDGAVDQNASEMFEEFLDEEVKSYRYDLNYGLVEVKKSVYFNEQGSDEEICFSLSVDKNGVSEQVIAEYKDIFYDYSPYFSKTKVYHSDSELTQVKEELYQEVVR